MRNLVLTVIVAVLAFATAFSAVRVATANLQDFGYGGSDCKGAIGITQMACFLSQYDVISCQEVMRASASGQRCYGCTGSLCHLDLLVGEMTRVSDAIWSYRVAGPYVYGTRYEYYAILFNTSTVRYLGKEGTADEVPGAPVFAVRPPFWAYFGSGNFDFVLVNYHAPSEGSSVSTSDEVRKLDGFIRALQASDETEQDIILAGDLNVTRISMSPTLDCSCKATLDYIVLDTAYTDHEWVQPCYTDTTLRTRSLSDHPILWAEFDTDQPDDD